MSQNMPAAEVDIDADLVRDLLADQHPDLAARPLALVAFGWDNVLFRLGPDLAVRLPRRALAAALVEHEQRWLPVLAPRLPLPVPVPVRTGVAGRGYPWRWTVTQWLEGELASDVALVDPIADAERLGAFLAALHQPAPPDAPHNPLRGVPLTDRDEVTEQRIDRLAATIDAPATRQRWRSLCATPPWTGPKLWLHGDLHPANLVVVDGRLAGVLDFGDLTGGDPATDLAAAWMLLPPEARPVLRRVAGGGRAGGGVDNDTWARAQGWALTHALACLASSADNPRLAGVGRRTLDAVLADG